MKAPLSPSQWLYEPQSPNLRRAEIRNLLRGPRNFVSKQTQQFTKLLPTFLTAISYFAACYFFTIPIKTMPICIAYAIWSGLGIVLISFVGFIFYKQSLDAAALIGLGLILAGVIVVNVFSKSIVH
ncbi:multidrug efflux SMR transporter [Acidisoma sp. S159]|uniref:DMT family transporter n=1 Tax=Acidisoma sp. S159 TaxID=1747225 RepID=UPI0020B17761|nr:multidrug efflux SMR transporter [Acidisoma sp. S159]